jgi:hypothetical protein
VPELVIPYTATGSAPVVGIRTGVLAATAKPVEAVTPELPMKAAAELLISTPSACGTLSTVHTSVAAWFADGSGEGRHYNRYVDQSKMG